ncbi:MAG: hypothetical protein R2710_13800 [Acidimicrobiales bacterium]
MQRTTVVDEYGFEEEVLDCPDGAVVTAPPAALIEGEPLDPELMQNVEGDLPVWVLADLVATLPDDDLRQRFEAITATIETMDATCGGDIGRWRQSIGELADQVEQATQRINDGALEGFVGSPEGRALGRAFFERAVLETGCGQPGAGEPLSYDDVVADGTLAATSRALLASAELSRLLQAAVMTDLFHFFSTLPNYEWLRAQSDPIDLVVYGTSQAGAAIDVPLLADLSGRPVGNAFLPGSLAEVQQHWFPEVDQYIHPQTVVWMMGAIDLLIDCEPNDRPEQFLVRLENRRRAFASSGWFRTLDPISVILGPPGPQREAPGNGDKKSSPDAAALAAHLEEYAPRLGATSFCASRAEVIAAAAQRMVDNGQDVIVIGAPLNPAALDLAPNLLPDTAAALEQLEGVLPAEVKVVDLSSTLQDPGLWSDLTHVTQSGAAEFTRLLATSIDEGSP